MNIDRFHSDFVRFNIIAAKQIIITSFIVIKPHIDVTGPTYPKRASSRPFPAHCTVFTPERSASFVNLESTS